MGDGFDRVRAPDPERPREPDPDGKHALYSVAPTAPPPAWAYVRCSSCDVERGLQLRELPGLLRPPWVLHPLGRRVWARCPSCGTRGWLELRRGEGAVRLRTRRNG